MNKTIVFICLVSVAAHAGPPLSGTPFQRLDLKLRWNVRSNTWPSALWTYRVTPASFPPAVISNLMALGSFTEQEKTIPYGGPDRRTLAFASSDKSRNLSIFTVCRGAEYSDRGSGQINMLVPAPDSNEVLPLALKLLPKLGILPSDLATRPNSTEPRVERTEQEQMIFTNNVFLTNICSRGIFFSRRVDGVIVRGSRTSTCRIEFGVHGKILRLSLLWPRWERVKSYPTVDAQTVMQRIRDGRAVLSSLPADIPPIDWALVKGVTINGAETVYSGDAKNVLEAQIYPYVALNALIDTGDTNVSAEIHCPILDDSK